MGVALPKRRTERWQRSTEEGLQYKAEVKAFMSKTNIKSKRTGTELSMRTFQGDDARSYLVFRTGKGAFHTFVETQAKEAARRCRKYIDGKEFTEGNTRQMWESIWRENG